MKKNLLILMFITVCSVLGALCLASCTENKPANPPPPAHVHSYTAVVTAPTCTEDGYTVYTCVCGDTYTSDSVKTTGHDWRSYPSRKPTCTEIGWKEYQTCARCNTSTYEEIPKLGHELHETQPPKEPTCTETGWSKYEACSRAGCDYVKIEEIPALGHDYNMYPAREPTCTDDGWAEYGICKRCGYNSQSVIPALGHDFQTYPALEPTCTNDGWQEYNSCSRCGHTTYQRLPALGHDWQYFPAQEPTCEEYGWKAYNLCLRCALSDPSQESVYLAPTGHTYSDEWSLDDIYHWHAGTCKHKDLVKDKSEHDYEDGKCKVCGCVTISDNLMFALNSDKNSYSVVYADGEINSVAVTIPRTYNELPVTGINSEAFKDCKNLISLVIPNGITSIGYKAFYGCTSLKYLSIADSVTFIGEYAFFGCGSLKTIRIASGVASVGKGAFENCTALESVVWYAENCTLSDGIFTGCANLNSVFIGDKVKIIPAYAFKGCTALLNCNIPDGVGVIGDEAFRNCKNLRNIVIPDSTTSLGAYAFDGCNSLASVTLGNGLIIIGNFAFAECSALNNVIWGENVKKIGDWAFSDCQKLKSAIIPDGALTIGIRAFDNCRSLYEVSIPDSVTSIGYQAFNGSAYYTNDANWLSGVLYIDNHLIKAKTAVSGTYKIKEGTLAVGDYAFEDCTYLTALVVPKSLNFIGLSAFIRCSSLAKVYYLGTKNEWEKISTAKNTELAKAEIYYYSVNEPALKEDGTGYVDNFWRYDNKGEIKEWVK